MAPLVEVAEKGLFVLSTDEIFAIDSVMKAEDLMTKARQAAVLARVLLDTYHLRGAMRNHVK